MNSEQHQITTSLGKKQQHNKNHNNNINNQMNVNNRDDDNDEKHDMYHERLQFQIEKERFQMEKDKFDQQMIAKEHAFQVEKDKFDQQMIAKEHAFQVEKDKFEIEKREFGLEKQQFQMQHQQFQMQSQQHTNQVLHRNSLSTIFDIIPESATISTIVPMEQPENEPQTWIETNILLTDDAKLLTNLEQSITEHGSQNVEIFEKAMRNLKRRAKVLEEKEADVKQRSEKLEPWEEKMQQLSVDNDWLNKEFEQHQQVLHTRWKSTWDSYLSSHNSYVHHGNIVISIYIENLKKTIIVDTEKQKTLIDTLWNDTESALSSILKNDWDNGRIPKVLDNTVKLFVSSQMMCEE